MTASPRTRIRSMDDVKRVTEHLGGHFFDAAAMRFFNSRILPDYYPVRVDVDSDDGARGYFVTSERFEDDPRRYTVRRFTCWSVDNDGRRDHKADIETVEFQTFTTAHAAKRYADMRRRVDAGLEN
jgi:hypothetical protein